jgi:quercetin 2,3-dioxygenase
MQTTVYKAENRGAADYGWLKARYSFSFANYYNPGQVRFGLLRVLNDDEVAPGAGFGTHPHDNMEIVTIPLEGSLEHKDSMGNGSVVEAGEVQVMSAGSGLTHSEFNHSKTQSLKLLQIWIFPKERDIEPRYGQMKYKEKLNEFVNLISPEEEEGKLSLNQDAWLHLGVFSAGSKVTINVNKKGNGLYLFLMDGKARIGGELMGRRDAIGVAETEIVEVESIEDSRILAIEVPMRA